MRPAERSSPSSRRRRCARQRPSRRRLPQRGPRDRWLLVGLGLLLGGLTLLSFGGADAPASPPPSLHATR
jgi:hypothetical protein